MPKGDNLKGVREATQFPHNDPTNGGHPKGKRITTILKEILSQDISSLNIKGLDIPEGIDGNKAIALELMAIAFDKKHKDKLSAIKEILDRMDGKVTQPLDLEVKKKIIEIQDID